MGVFMVYCGILISAMVVFQVSRSQDECKGSTCKDCIRFASDCAWCSQKSFNGTRCQKINNLKVVCQVDQIQFPNSLSSPIEQVNVRDGNSKENPIQVTPQKVAMKLRLRDTYSNNKITMYFRAANNFPVDLYFLFDNSKSMQPYITDLAQLAGNIGKSIGNISSNYTFGYGVFQDKVVLPFTDTTPAKLLNPCANEICSPPVEFQHILSMTKNLTQFTDVVNTTKISGNLDHPEGSLDAIMQAITCKEEIGWRNGSRKLLILATNDRFHLAGDGRLAGIVAPNDGACHLDSVKKYSKELTQDYPSISQIRETVIKNEVHIIFAVKDQREIFEELEKLVPNSVVESLADSKDSSQSMEKIIERKYREMISKVEMKHNNIPGVTVSIKATSDICDAKGTNVCKAKQLIGETITFEVDISISDCSTKTRTLTIFPESMRQDSLTVIIEALCDCDCEVKNNTWETASDLCNGGNGSLVCGLCECNQNYFGQNCECTSTNLDSGQTQCNRAGENSTKVCSGVGECECGKCICKDGYSGTFCECNDQACGLFQRQVCGGVRGQCDCGECKCAKGYTGSTCQCSVYNDTCKSPTTGQVCSDQGICECDTCVCKKGYTGKYCENCFLCGDNICDNNQYRQCAQCHFDKKTTCDEDCPSVEIVDSLKSYQVSNPCSIKQEDGCFLSFYVISSETNVTIIVQKTKTCSEPVDILPIVAAVVGGVVAIGLLLLLLWKILTSIFDKIEYARFQEDLKQCKWAKQENPVYKGATTTYKNPMMDSTEPLDGK
ncbi:integrin beta-1 [Biomphalaria pfeifferi]|uniref:Integrin beta n=1 Tax=Biomphalaria pfeifferi TaxID=112525 RepID=A0AAD8B7F9_BIOPF|nr:integrin beta-1 [Biomphalaria pfeifferi]